MSDDLNSLLQRVRQLEAELAEAKNKNANLERSKGAGASGEDLSVPINEFEETLRRLVQRTAMIVQSEKCVIMVRDRETGDLFARSPAFGMSESEVKSFRIHGEKGISGEVFRTGRPAIFHSAEEDERTIKEIVHLLRIRNGVTVPLAIEKRDEHNHVVDRVTIGVLHCFNKRYGAEFIEEDVRLLERLSRNAAAVIANAQMFQEVVEEKQRLVHTLESLTAGLVLINQHGRIGQMNAQARAMFAVPENQNPVGKLVEDIIKHEECLNIIKGKITPGERVETVPVEGAEEVEEERKKPDEITIVDEEEQRYIYQVHAAAVHDDSDTSIGTVVIFNDITDMRNVEQMKTEFVSIVSHELRTPLTPMKGFVRTLLDDEKEEWYTLEDRREFYGIIDTNVDRLSRLINDLLNVSRIEKKGVEGIEMNFEEVDIRKAADEAIATQSGRTERHTFITDFIPEHIIAETDADKILNILQNIISNAIKYAPDGGNVTVIGRLEAETDTVLIGVRDQGMGIPESSQKKLFKMFGRLDNTNQRGVGGTGIGLYLVKNLVVAHKGHIWVESALGKGTTFWFRIPVRQAAPGEPGREIHSGRSEEEIANDPGSADESV